MMNKRYLSPRQAAQYLGISTHLLQKWRSQGIGVPYVKLGDTKSAHIRYCIDDLDEYIENKKIKTL